MKYLRIVLFGIGLIFSFATNAQDHHFSQYNSSPLSLNPALTGSINGQDRIITNYRNQWPQLLQYDSYQTFALSYDRRENFKSGDCLGIGVSYYGDVAGSARFGTIQLALSFSYAKTISKSSSSKHSLIGGLHFGAAQRKVNPINLRLPSQSEPYGSIGVVTQTDFLFSDFNGGILWVSSFGERKSFHSGIAVSHINRPNVSFQVNSIQRMSMKTSIHVGAELPLSSRLSILPSILLLKQGVHAQLNAGTILSVSNSSSFISNIQGGIYYRAGKDLTGSLHSDAIISLVSIQLKGIQLGLSYDFSISKLKVNSLGAFEVSIGYIINKINQEVTPYAVPQF